MKKCIKLRVTKIAAKTCDIYDSCQNCLIATAAKIQFRTGCVCAWPRRITIAGIGYTYGDSVEVKIKRCYVRETTGEFKLRRIRPDFRPFNIILTAVPSL